MKKIIPVKIKGLKCFIDDITLKPYFESKSTEYKMAWSGYSRGQMGWVTTTEKLYISVPRKGFWVGFGAIAWLNNHSEDIRFKIESIEPSRGQFEGPYEIPKAIKESPKFLVNGKERYYLYEALKACFLKPFGIVKLPTGSGKTVLELIIAHNQNKQIGMGLIIVPTLAIKEQFLKDAKRWGLSSIKDIKNFDSKDNASTYLTTIKLLSDGIRCKKKHVLDILKGVKHCQVDECFSPDVEIFTEKGFIRFDKLQEKTKVAQYNIDNCGISFVNPTRRIIKDYEGTLIKLKSDRLLDLDITPNHEIITSVRGNKKKIKVKDLKHHYKIKMPVAGLGIGEEESLSDYEKLMVITQADGHIFRVYKGTSKRYPNNSLGQSSIQFQFSKERKIVEFLKLVKEGKIKYNEVKKSPSKGKIKEKRRWIVTNIENVTKNLWEVFDITKISYKKAREIIEYMVIWDGSKIKENSYYFSSIKEDQVDFYQCIAIIAGYKTNKIKQVDNRSKSYNDIYRLFIVKNKDEISTQSLNKSEFPYKGKVYCVSVPDGNIIVRRSGKVLITGNCHHVSCKSLYQILFSMENCERIHGFSALPVTQDVHNAKEFDELNFKDARVIGVIGPVIYQKSAQDLKDFLNIPNMINYEYKWKKNYSPYQKSKDWHEVRKAMVENGDRSRFLASIMDYLIESQYKVALFVNEKAHARKILQYCVNKLTCCWFGGRECFDTKGEVEIDYLREEFGKEIFGLLLTSHAIEGLDFNNPINALILQEGKSERQNVQKPGRVVRPDDKGSIIINIFDKNCNILPKHARARSLIIENEFNCNPLSCSTFDEFKETLNKLNV